MPNSKIDSRNYFYADVGQGIPLLLFHGFPLSSESFWPQIESPPKGFRLLIPDHRGFGKSDLGLESGFASSAREAGGGTKNAGTGISTMESMAQDGLSLLDSLGIESAFIGGVSMGGYVSIALARMNPGRVRGLVLIDSQSTADDAAAQERRENTAKECETVGSQNLVAQMLPRLFAPNTSLDVTKRLENIMRAQNPMAVAQAARGMAKRLDGKDILTRLAGNSLIVVGEHDVLTPVEKSKQMHEMLVGSKLEIIPGVGHLPNLEKPIEFGAVLESFAKRCS
jgi:pimeloyl-ACP methyl ester carboxylesterase